MSIFFTDEKYRVDESIMILGEDARHLIRVLRYKPGDIIRISDGIYAQGSAVIEEVTRDNVIKVKVLEKNSIDILKPRITLIQGVPKGDKMDFILQKNTELGVREFWPVITERTIVELSGDKMRRRGLRWQKILREAAKQCGRPDIPEVKFPMNFDQVLMRTRDYDIALIPWEREKAYRLSEVFESAKEKISTVAVFIGPEGGFSEDEIERASQAGFLPVSLGPRILRTETAGMAINSIIMYELGDLGGKTCQR